MFVSIFAEKFPSFSMYFAAPAFWAIALGYFAYCHELLLPFSAWEKPPEGFGGLALILLVGVAWLGFLMILGLGIQVRKTARETLEKQAARRPVFSEDVFNSDDWD